MRTGLIVLFSSLAALSAGCERAALRHLDDGTAKLTQLDYAGAEPDLARAASSDVDKAVSLENHGIALAWSGRVNDGVAEIQQAVAIYSLDDRPRQEHALYAIGRAYQQAHDCPNTRIAYAAFVKYAGRFPDDQTNVDIANQNVAIVCKDPKAFTMGPDTQPASGPADASPASSSAAPASTPTIR